MPFKGTRKVEVTLKAGTYTYQCDPHAAGGMKATFTVTAAAASAPATTTDDSGNDASMGSGY